MRWYLIAIQLPGGATAHTQILSGSRANALEQAKLIHSDGLGFAVTNEREQADGPFPGVQGGSSGMGGLNPSEAAIQERLLEDRSLQQALFEQARGIPEHGRSPIEKFIARQFDTFKAAFDLRSVVGPEFENDLGFQFGSGLASLPTDSGGQRQGFSDFSRQNTFLDLGLPKRFLDALTALTPRQSDALSNLPGPINPNTGDIQSQAIRPGASRLALAGGLRERFGTPFAGTLAARAVTDAAFNRFRLTPEFATGEDNFLNSLRRKFGF